MLCSSLFTGVHHTLLQERLPLFLIHGQDSIQILYVPFVKYPVTETVYGKELETELQHIRQFVKTMLIKEESHVRRQSCEQPA